MGIFKPLKPLQMGTEAPLFAGDLATIYAELLVLVAKSGLLFNPAKQSFSFPSVSQHRYKFKINACLEQTPADTDSHAQLTQAVQRLISLCTQYETQIQDEETQLADLNQQTATSMEQQAEALGSGQFLELERLEQDELERTELSQQIQKRLQRRQASLGVIQQHRALVQWMLDSFNQRQREQAEQVAFNELFSAFVALAPAVKAYVERCLTEQLPLRLDYLNQQVWQLIHQQQPRFERKGSQMLEHMRRVHEAERAGTLPVYQNLLDFRLPSVTKSDTSTLEEFVGGASLDE